MNAIKIKSEFFNAKDTLECGQVFRYSEQGGVYTVFSLDKLAKVYTNNEYTFIETDDVEYFTSYFDLKTDYRLIFDGILGVNNPFLTNVAQLAKGIRILKQDVTETAFSFIISQNNNIKRIQSTIEKLCKALRKKIIKNGVEFYAFPSV